MRAALVLALLLGTASTAAADGLYFSESFGGSNVKDELGSHINGAVRIRFALGYRINKSWAVEGFVAGDVGTVSHIHADDRPYAARCIDCAEPDGGYGGWGHSSSSSMTTVGLDVKYLRPLSDNIDVYLRGSLGKGYLDDSDYSGRGLGIGTGVQLKGKVRALGFLFWPLFFVPVGPKVTAALFVDGGADFYRLHRHGDLDNNDAIDGSISRLTLGFAVGSDF